MTLFQLEYQDHIHHDWILQEQQDKDQDRDQYQDGGSYYDY